MPIHMILPVPGSLVQPEHLVAYYPFDGHTRNAAPRSAGRYDIAVYCGTLICYVEYRVLELYCCNSVSHDRLCMPIAAALVITIFPFTMECLGVATSRALQAKPNALAFLQPAAWK